MKGPSVIALSEHDENLRVAAKADPSVGTLNDAKRLFRKLLIPTEYIYFRLQTSLSKISKIKFFLGNFG